jgi:hypothetical protein
MAFELVSEVGAMPLRKRTAYLVGTFTGQLDHIQGHLRRKERGTAWSRFFR